MQGQTAVDTEKQVFIVGTSVAESATQQNVQASTGPTQTPLSFSTPTTSQQPSPSQAPSFGQQPSIQQPNFGQGSTPQIPGQINQGQQPQFGQQPQLNQPSQPSGLPSQPSQLGPQQQQQQQQPQTSNLPIQSQLNRLPDAGYELVFMSNLPNDLTWVDVHYSVNQGMQLNFRMEPMSPRRFGHRRILLNEGDVLRYSFTYDVNGLAVDSQMFEYRATATGQQSPQGLSGLNQGQAPTQPGQPGAGGISQQPNLPSNLPSQSQSPFGQQQQQPQQPSGLQIPGQIQQQPPLTSTCAQTDYECQLRRACDGCVQNPGLAVCLSCVSLNRCTTTACQINEVCGLCRLTPTADKPAICGMITGC